MLMVPLFFEDLTPATLISRIRSLSLNSLELLALACTTCEPESL
jgi:hypothetical protein